MIKNNTYISYRPKEKYEECKGHICHQSCIPKHALCDKENDCLDKSDEIPCRYCKLDAPATMMKPMYLTTLGYISCGTETRCEQPERDDLNLCNYCCNNGYSDIDKYPILRERKSLSSTKNKTEEIERILHQIINQKKNTKISIINNNDKNNAFMAPDGPLRARKWECEIINKKTIMKVTYPYNRYKDYDRVHLTRTHDIARMLPKEGKDCIRTTSEIQCDISYDKRIKSIYISIGTQYTRLMATFKETMCTGINGLLQIVTKKTRNKYYPV